MVEALVAAVRAAYPRLSHRYYALKAQLVRQEAAAALGPQRAAAEGRDPHDRLDRSAARPCSRPMARSRRDMAAIAERFFKDNWIDAPVRPGKRRARSRIRPCRRRILTCCSTIRASRAT